MGRVSEIINESSMHLEAKAGQCEGVDRNLNSSLCTQSRRAPAGQKIGSVFLESIEQQGAENHGAEYDELQTGPHAGEVHAVLDHGSDEGSDQSAEHFALAPGK